jgi:hypothetical protein
LDEGATDAERELLLAGRRYAPPRALRRRTLVGLGLGGALTTSSTAAALQSLKVLFTAKGWISIAAWACVTVGAGATARVIVTHARSTNVDPPAVVASVSALPAAPPANSAPPDTAAPDTVSPPDTAAPDSEPPPPPSTLPSAKPLGLRAPREAVSAAPSAAPPADSLAEEVALVEEARRAVRARDAGRALAAIDAHARRFPRGKLGLEVTVLRIEALLAQGNRAAARSVGERFLAAHPNHVLSDRVRALLGIEAEKKP